MQGKLCSDYYKQLTVHKGHVKGGGVCSEMKNHLAARRRGFKGMKPSLRPILLIHRPRNLFFRSDSQANSICEDPTQQNGYFQ